MNNRTVYLFSSLFLLICCWQPLSAHAVYQKKIDFKAQNKPLKTILNLLEEQSNYFFLYDNTLLEKHQNININIESLSFKDALDLLSERINIDYKIVDNTVTLFPKKAKAQQEKLITGTIKLKDTDNDVPYTTNGVSIQVKGTNKGTSTNFKGEFSLQVPVPSTLVISYIGYDKQEFSVTPSTVSVQSTLKQSEGSISEVIVTAYGTKETRENQIGSAYTITAKDIEKRPSLRIDALLEGVVPGVQFSSQDAGSSAPRPRYSTRIRGESSSPGGTMSNEPLWVIDGVPLNTGGTTNSIAGVETTISPLTYLNPEDIESVTVLKDASAAALYGASASNGVIIIRTKKGQGEPKVRYTYRWTMDKIAKHNTYNTLNSEQYRSIINEMNLNDKIAVYEEGSTDWLKDYYDSGRINQHNISVSGSNANTNYYISGSIYDQKLTSIGNSTKRYSLRSQVNTDIGSRLSVGFVFGGSYNQNDIFRVSNSFYSNLPIVSPYNRDGSYAVLDYAGNRIMPSLAERIQNDYIQNGLQSFGQMQATFRIIDGLELSSHNGIDFTSLDELRYHSMLNLTGQSNNGQLYKNQSQMYNLTTTNMLNYSKNIYDGQLSATLGIEANMDNRSSVGASAFGFPNDHVREINMAPADNRRSSGTREKNASLSHLGRLGYLWSNKYNASFSFRRDGDSDFGKDVKWSTFYAAGAAWTVSNEEFWKSKIINFLKVKMSYGTTGNGRFNGNYAKGLYTFKDSETYGDIIGATMSRGRNSHIRWETTYKFNTGIDFKLFNRVDVGLEYYKDITRDLVYNTPVSLTSGQRSIYRNVGSLQNTGFEAVIKSTNIQTENFYWFTNFNLSLNRNKVLELAEGFSRSTGNNITQEGYDSRALYLVRWAGVDPSTGAPMWYDINGNVTKVYDPENRVIIGSPNPDFYGGITNTLSYRNFNLSFLLTYTKGGLLLNELSNRAEHDGRNILNTNMSVNLLDHWQYPGDLSVNPMLTTMSNNSNRYSTRYLQDKSHIQFKNISLEYNVPSEHLKRFFLKGASIYAIADNLAIWTPYRTHKKLNKGNGNTETIRLNTYANSREGLPEQISFSLGVNLTF